MRKPPLSQPQRDRYDIHGPCFRPEIITPFRVMLQQHALRLKETRNPIHGNRRLKDASMNDGEGAHWAWLQVEIHVVWWYCKKAMSE